MEEKVVSIASGETRDSFQYDRLPIDITIWREHKDLIFLQAVNPTELSSVAGLWSRELVGGYAELLEYGGHNDVSRIVDIGVKSQYAVEVAENLITKFDVYDENNQHFTAFQTTADYAMGYNWDMVFTKDEKYVFVTTKSSAVSGELANVWSGVTEFGRKGVLSKKLSAHNSWFNSKVAPDAKPFFWTGSDGMKLEGVISYPRGVDLKILPTVVVAHGGPGAYVIF
jgi:dipeptidyl aminopeptidase/acylaminoacyl peptidase